MRLPTRIWQALTRKENADVPADGCVPVEPPHIVKSRRSGPIIPYSEALGMPAQLWHIRIGPDLSPGEAVRVIASSPQGRFPPQESTFVVSAIDVGGEVSGVITIPALLPAEVRCQRMGDGCLFSESHPITPAPEALLEERQLHFQSVLDRVSFPSFKFECKLSGEALYLQISCNGTCNITGVPMCWKSGKWLLSQHMMDSEIVQKALKATLTAIEHEARELFLYRGLAIFDPHFNVDKLWDLRSESDSVVQRQAASAV